MTTDPHTPGMLTLHALDGATVELDVRTIPPGTVVILQAREDATAEILDAARRRLQDLLGEDVAGRFVIADNGWRIWPVTLTEPRPDPPATFTIRPAGEPEDVTVALHSLSDCPVCGHPIAAGAFVVVSDDPDDPEGPDRWAHESCARPQNPTRPALNADQTRARS